MSARSIPRVSIIIESDSSEDIRQQALKHYRIGYELLKTRNYRNAAIEFEHAAAIDSSYAEAFYLLGQTYAKLEEYDGAIEALERTRQLGMFRDRVDAKLAVLHQNSALTLYGQRKYREAIAAFEKSLELNPQNARALYNLGLCHNRLNDAASARRAFERAIEADPGYANPHKSLGDLHRAGRNHSRSGCRLPAGHRGRPGLRRRLRRPRPGAHRDRRPRQGPPHAAEGG